MTPKDFNEWLHHCSVFLRQTVTENRYIPHKPTPKQSFFLSLLNKEALYGGAAGGGKSDALLMAALQYVHVPHYSALLLRKTFADLVKPEGLMPRATSWLAETGAKWRASERSWRFPSGASLSFGYLLNPNDVYQYQGAAYQFIGFDELTQFRESDYRYLFSRLRRSTDMGTAGVPLRMRAGTNPGGKGHVWVKRRFFDEGRKKGRVFVPSTLKENPHLDEAAYRETLAELDHTTRRQLEDGDWDVRPPGTMFKYEWFSNRILKMAPPGCLWVRYWDLAATEPAKGMDPDWTSGALLGYLKGQWFLKHMSHFQSTPKGVEDRIKMKAASDGRDVAIRLEQEPGASGKIVIDHYARNVLPGYNFGGQPSLLDKVLRAGPFSSAAERGNFFLIEGDWIGDFLDEIVAFPETNHDDQVDAVTGGMNHLAGGRKIILV